MHSDPPVTALPLGSRLLRMHYVGEETSPKVGENQSGEETSPEVGHSQSASCAATSTKGFFGVPWTIDEFLQKAMYAKRPRLITSCIPPELDAAIRKNVNWSRDTVMRSAREAEGGSDLQCHRTCALPGGQVHQNGTSVVPTLCGLAHLRQSRK